MALLHCTSEYPAPAVEMNLRAMVTLAETFRLPVGLSDHSTGIEAAITVVGMGAAILEKHFTVDKTLPGPDHRASLDAGELTQMVAAIRKTESMMGDGIKRPTAAEKANMNGIRRGVVVTRAVAEGTVLTADILACKRPGGGVDPEQLERVIGLKLARAYEEDEPLQWRDLLQ